MKTTIRATLSVALLAGFYLLAVGVIVGLGWVSVWLWREHAGVAAGKISYLTIAVAAGIAVAFWKILRAKPDEPGGLPVSEHEAPELWNTARDLAHRVGTRAPDEIRLVPDVNAAVEEHTRLLGLVGGRRIMYVGMPLIQAFTVGQLQSVLAHELGHYSGSHTRVGALAHRGRMAIVQTVAQIGPSTLVGRLFKLYAGLYILVEQAVSRRMEYEADEFSVRIAGRATAIRAMRDIPVVDAAWDFFVGNYVTIGWDAKLAPRDVFGGFGELLRGRSGELGRLRSGAPPSESSRWDSHPPIADRIRAMEGMADSGVAADDRPAAVLLRDPAGLAGRLQHEALAIEGRTLLPWEELTDAGIAAGAQRQADVLFRAAARLTGSQQGDLGMVLDLVEQGRGAELARAVAPHADAEDLPDALAGNLAAAVALAARAGSGARWQHSWSSGAKFVDAAGRRLPLDEAAKLAAAPATLPQARQLFTDLGVAVAAARQQSTAASATGADVLGGIANMKSGKEHFDVLILDNGLLLVPGPKSTDNGKQRLLQILGSAPIEELARRHRFVAFEDIATATILKRVPVRVAITLHRGETFELHQPWTGEALDRNDDDLLRGALEPFVATPEHA